MKNLISKISSKNPKELLIYAAIIGVAIFLFSYFLVPYIKKLATNVKYRVAGGKTEDGSSVKTLTNARKATLAGLSKDLYDQVYSPLGSFANREDPLSNLNALNDAEFIYSYESYMRQFSANPYYDLSWEAFVGPEKDIYMTRATSMSLPIGQADINPNDSKG